MGRTMWPAGGFFAPVGELESPLDRQFRERQFESGRERLNVAR
jgi:hypothetical protein